MKPETEAILYRVEKKLEDLREILDDYMYRSGGIPDTDHDYCRRVYNSICKTIDLL